MSKTNAQDEAWWEEKQPEYDRLRQFMELNKHALDDALEQQPSLYLDACDLYIYATDKRDYFKDRLSRVQAQTGQALRETGDYKTEGAVKEAVEDDDAVIRGKARLSFWTTKMNQCFALREALDQRGKVLREMVHLWTSGYYQQASAGGAAHRADTHRYEQSRANLARARSERPSLGGK